MAARTDTVMATAVLLLALVGRDALRAASAATTEAMTRPRGPREARVESDHL